MTKTLTFHKGGSSSKSPVRTPDTLISTDTVEVLLGITEGPAAGLVDGPKTFYADGTSLVGTGGDTNFKNFALDIYPGSEAGHTIAMSLGGFSNPINIGVNLASGVPVTRNGVVAGIDCVDFRVVVQQLFRNNDQGSFTNSLSLKFEVKKTTDPSWQPAWTATGSSDPDIDPGPDGTVKGWTFFDRTFKSDSFLGDQQAITLAAAPATPPPSPTQDATALVGDGTTVSSVYHWDSEDGTWAVVPTTPTDPRYDTLPSGKRVYKVSATAPADARIGDMWYSSVGLLVSSYRVVVWNGAAWVKPNEFSAPPAPTTPDGVWTINEKVSSATSKDIRIYLPNANPGDVWQYRVTKLSPDSGTEDFSEVTWEGVQEISRSPMTFEGLAMARVIGRASDQFTALPVWESDWRGRIVKVPTNYDPETRVYTGVWDGTFKLAWTNCTAWIFQDFVENTRYGMSSIYAQTVNKWKIYEWAQVCDTMVLRPDGITYRPRWTYNEWVTTARDAKEMTEYIAGSAGARYVDDGNGIVEVVIDKDDPAVAIFTVENIGEDGFSYSYTDRLTRANDTTIEFINPALNWGKDKRVVRDDDDIAIYGRIPENFIAVACTDVDEALARGRRRLIGGLTEKEIVSFTTNRKGRYLSEWNVILVGDEDMGRGLTGRIRAVTGASSVSLRDPISLEAGITYWATFDVVNPAYPATSSEPYKTERRQITNAAGPSQMDLAFATPLPALSEYAAFVIEAPEVLGFPKPYRITNISDDGGTGEKIRITALELNRNKYAFIDTGVDQGPIQYSNFQNVTVDPASNPQIELLTRLKGSISTRVARIFWDKSPYQWVRRYKVFHSVNGAPAGAIDTNLLEVEFEGLENGIHTFAVVAIDVRGRESLPVNVSCNLTGASRPVSGPSNLLLVGGTSPTAFNTLDATFAWDAADPSPNFKNYQVLVTDVSTSMVVHTEDVGSALTWTYSFYTNKLDGAGTPRRTFKVTVISIDDDLNQSPALELTVINAAPGAPTVTYSPTLGGVVINLTPSVDIDVAGAYIWANNTNGFNPAVVLPTNQGDQSSFFLPLFSGSSTYVRAAYYDEFSSSQVGLNYSSQITVTSNMVTIADIDTTPPSVPTGLALSSTLSTQPDGTQLIKLTASWNPVTGDSSLDGYEIDVQEGAGSFIEFGTSLTTYDWFVKANIGYTAKVRAVDKFGNRSVFSSTVSHTTTKDTTAPAAPTSVVSTAAIQTGWLSWVNDSAIDLSEVEVWENTVNNSGTATRIATVNALPSTAGGYTRSGLATGTIKYYWLKSVDTSGNRSGFSSGVSMTPASVTNADIVVGTLTGDRVQAGTLAGDRFITNTSLPGTITVGVTGVSIGTIQTQANDPAARVNAMTTKITPGLIQISGATTLADWRNGTDTTKIEGGSIYANSIAANSLKIGSRGISTVALDFAVTAAKTTLYWAAGYILYTNDAGVLTSIAITAGSTTYLSGFTYVYWVKDSTTLIATSNVTVALGLNNVLMCSWYGGGNFSVTSGVGTVITDDRIVTASVNANRLVARTIVSDLIASNQITARMLLIGGTEEVYPDGDKQDILWWREGGGSATSGLTQGFFGAGWTVGGDRGLIISNGTTDSFSQFFKVEPGATYRIRARIWNLAGGWVGTVWPLIHMPSIQWYSLKHGGAVNPATADASNAIVAAGDTGNLEWVYTNPTTCTQWQFYMKASITSGAPVYLQVSIVRMNDTTLIQDGSITTNKVVVNSLNGDRIQVGTLNADRLVAGSVTTTMLSVQSDAINKDPYFYDTNYWTCVGPGGSLPPTSISTGWYMENVNTTILSYTQAPQYMVLHAPYLSTSLTARYHLYTGAFGTPNKSTYETVQPNTIYTMSLGCYNSSNQWLGFQVDWYTVSGVYITSNAATVILPSTAGVFSTQVTSPTTAYFARLVLYNEAVTTYSGTCYVGGFFLRKALQGSLYVDGSITASKLLVTSLSAITANLGTITAGSLNINNRFIVASDGTTTIQSSASGARLVLTNSLIQVFDASNVERVRLGIW